jgi:hypothetical protein
MKRSLFFVLFAFILFNTYPQKIKRLQAKEIEQVLLRYPENQLRIPNSKFPIGISVRTNSDTILRTKGYLQGDLLWRNFSVEVEGGSYWSGEITVGTSTGYSKGKQLLVKIYHRKSKKLLTEQYIPLHYETAMKILTRGNFDQAPGEKIKLGFKTMFNNGEAVEHWPLWGLGVQNNYALTCSGAYWRWGKLCINEDPFEIENHCSSITGTLKKAPEIKGSLSIELDYKKDYRKTFWGENGRDGHNGQNGANGCNGADGQHGDWGQDGQWGQPAPDVFVYLDAYYDTIIHEVMLFANVLNSYSEKPYNYLINTDGGSLHINSYGGNGGNGGDGGKGGDGGTGADGQWITETKTKADGTQEEIKKQLRGQNGGNGGSGGNGGCGGHGGSGGNIRVCYTQNAAQYLSLIQAYSTGGSGGWSGHGGSNGSGGNGGEGNPNGTSGSSGTSGMNGWNGESGYSGTVEYIVISEDELYLPVDWGRSRPYSTLK